MWITSEVVSYKISSFFFSFFVLHTNRDNTPTSVNKHIHILFQEDGIRSVEA